jgi:thiol-disulfide isomerase/thioredoxin
MCGTIRTPRILGSCVLGVTIILASRAAAEPTVQQALGLAPVQKQVEFDRPTGTDIGRCTIKELKEGKLTGWIVYGAGGQTLRRFVDTNSDGALDLWCYFKDGLEVYRDIDSDFNRKADQYRWLNTAGTRIGIDKNEDGTVDGWQAISAEEATQEAVLALASGDEARFDRLLLSDTELETLGLGADKAKEVAERLAASKKAFGESAARQKSLGATTHWSHFGGSKPGTVPAGTEGSTKDLVVYENVVTMAETKGKHDQIHIGTIVRAGGNWRLVDAPHVISGKGGELAGSGLFFRGPAPHLPNQPGDAATSSIAEDVRKVLAEMEKVEKALSAAGDSKETATLYARRTELLEQLIEKSKDETERLQWLRQLADSVSMAVQSGAYPAGLSRLEELLERAKKKPESEETVSYLAYRLLMAEYGHGLQQADADFAKIQVTWTDNLKKFVADYPKSADAPDAMLQLAQAEEFSGREKEAKNWYSRIAEEFPKATAAKKAAGAKARLELVGNKMPLRGRTLDGKVFDMSAVAGRTVLVHYWASWSEPCKADIAQLKTIHSKYARQGFAIVGVSFDNSPQELAAFVKEERIAWPQIYEPGGQENRLAHELGIMTLPTMILVDRTGKVVNRNVLAADLEKALSQLLSSTATGEPAKKKR